MRGAAVRPHRPVRPPSRGGGPHSRDRQGSQHRQVRMVSRARCGSPERHPPRGFPLLRLRRPPETIVLHSRKPRWWPSHGPSFRLARGQRHRARSNLSLGGSAPLECGTPPVAQASKSRARAAIDDRSRPRPPQHWRRVLREVGRFALDAHQFAVGKRAHQSSAPGPKTERTTRTFVMCRWTAPGRSRTPIRWLARIYRLKFEYRSALRFR